MPAVWRALTAATRTAGDAGSGGLVLLYMRGQRAQRGKDLAVVFIVRAQLESVTLADRQREFQRVDRIQSQSGVEQRRFRVDVARIGAFQVEALDQQIGQ